ncbi:MAG: hypothetical protein Q8L27_01095 [archaeon]|nr:hypothetical protein [archaeon]
MTLSIKNLVERILEKPIRNLAIATLGTLIATTALKENVHFGSTTINNPKRNQYSWGLIPNLTIEGEEAKGNFYSFGLLITENKISANTRHDGNSTAIGLLAGFNTYESNSVHNGNSTAIGLVAGANFHGSNSVHNGNSTAIGLLAGGNIYETNSVHNGNSTAIGLIVGLNNYETNSVHNGNSGVKGIISEDSKGMQFLSNKIIKNPDKKPINVNPEFNLK